MIITRSPLRLTFGGGGTDLPSYYEKFGGELVSGAIDKYVYISLHKTFQKEFIIKYSQYERVQSLAEIKHPILREALSMFKTEPQLEIVSMADVPDGTGLGSSGAFTVALLKALTHHLRIPALTQDLARMACEIEIDKLHQPIGKQDQYASAFGGLTRFVFHKSGDVEAHPVSIDPKTLAKLEDGLLLFFTGYTRSASTVLSDQKKKSESMDKDMLANLHFTKELGVSSRLALEQGNLDEFADLMHVHWENKRKRSSGMSQSKIDAAYADARAAGVRGGKLIGAGGGGFLMFYTEDGTALREVMTRHGYEEVRFHFDFEGVKTIVV